MAQKWVAQGAKRLHLVDLDGAFQGQPVNADVIEDKVLKKTALCALVAKYAPDHIAAGDAYIDRLMGQTAVVRVSIEYLAGKARK